MFENHTVLIPENEKKLKTKKRKMIGRYAHLNSEDDCERGVTSPATPPILMELQTILEEDGEQKTTASVTPTAPATPVTPTIPAVTPAQEQWNREYKQSILRESKKFHMRLCIFMVSVITLFIWWCMTSSEHTTCTLSSETYIEDSKEYVYSGVLNEQEFRSGVLTIFQTASEKEYKLGELHVCWKNFNNFNWVLEHPYPKTKDYMFIVGMDVGIMIFCLVGYYSDKCKHQ